jgi:hypothetical protein
MLETKCKNIQHASTFLQYPMVMHEMYIQLITILSALLLILEHNI